MRQKIKIILAFSFLFLPMCLFAQWSVVGEMPYPVAGGSAVVLDSKIYILGGYSDETQSPIDLIQFYDPFTGLWDTVGTMEEARFGLNAEVWNGSIFYYGGISDSSDFVEAMGVCTVSENNAKWIAGMDSSFNRIFASSVSFDNRMFIFGGSSYESKDTVKLPYLSVFNFDSLKVTFSKDTLYPQSDLPIRQMAVNVGPDIYIFGGISNTILNKIYKYHIPTNSFSKINWEMAYPRAGGSAVYIPDESMILLIGGSDESDNAVASSEAFYVFDGALTSAPAYGSLKTARSDLMAVYFQNKIYVFGGFDANGNVVEEIERIDVQPVTTMAETDIPSGFGLLQNYPNPFNPETKIQFQISSRSEIKLEVYSPLGEKINTLVDATMNAGLHAVSWDGNNSNGYPMPSGIYLYRFTDYSKTIVKKMMLIR